MRLPMAPRCLLGLAVWSSYAFALSWWADASCETRLGVGTLEKMFDEAIDTAKAVVTKLDARDANMEYAFKELVGFNYNSPEGDEVVQKEYFKSRSSRGSIDLYDRLTARSIGVIGSTGPNSFSGVTAFQPSAGSGEDARKNAYLRVYCQNGQQWQQAPDDPNILPPNSQRPVEARTYIDMINMVGAAGVQCGSGVTMATTSRNEMPIAPGTQSAKRVILDVSLHFALRGSR